MGGGVVGGAVTASRGKTTVAYVILQHTKHVQRNMSLLHVLIKEVSLF